MAHRGHRHHNYSNDGDQKDRDHGMLGVLVHLIADCMSNISVIVSGTIIWQAPSLGEARFRADPAASLVISFLILLSALPLGRHMASADQASNLTIDQKFELLAR